VRRREALALLGGAAALWPLAGAAQRPAKRRLIATLTIGSQAPFEAFFEPFRQTLGALGYGDDKIAIESRLADGHADRLPGLAAELVRLSPDVILASQSASATVLQQATATIPIVFAVSDDPIGAGLAASLARPGGNITGMSFAGVETAGKELQLLKEMAPAAHRIAVLVNPNNGLAPLILQALQQAAATLQTEVVAVEAGAPGRIAPAFAKIGGEHADALLVLGDGMFNGERKQIIALAASHRLPAIYHDHIYVEDGGLISYGGDLGDNYRGAARLVAKILNGAKPADLPIEQPTRFYLFINRKTAETLGLAIPSLLLTQADKIIE
jgi:putative ABC transport system substrate-binding protein